MFKCEITFAFSNGHFIYNNHHIIEFYISKYLGCLTRLELAPT